VLTKSEVGGYELRSAVESEANDGRSCSLVECDAEATLSRALMRESRRRRVLFWWSKKGVLQGGRVALGFSYRKWRSTSK
jgi:hypothetical protein